MGLYFNKISERIRENRRLKKVESYFVSQLSFLDRQLSAEIEQLDLCLQKLNNWDTNDIILNQTSNRISKRLLDITQEDLFTIFIHRKKGDITENTECYNNMIGSLDHISRVLPHVLDANKKANNELNSCYDNWNSYLISISKIHNTSITDNLIDNSFVGELNTILKEFERKYKNSSNIKATYNFQIRPIIELCKKYSKDKTAQELMTICDKAKIEFLQIKFLRENHATFIELNKKVLTATKKELSEKLIEFKGKKTKKNYVA
ncbi:MULTISPECIES: hypothetical protein [unclassified Carboxylicivirga]|uniref:hypothetical protein n=1 Tax=Carboxylicivirga TaxID=1628153 RepID=UPI003D32A2D3